MAEIQMVKLAGGTLRPANQTDADALSKVGNGNLVFVDFKQPRNAKFHKKFWAMVGFAFEYWEVPDDLQFKGIKPEKNFDRFRKDLLILAGFRTLVVNVKGECRYEAESISFGSMDDTRFSEVYRAVFGVGWQMILSKIPGMSEQAAQNAINQMINFD